MKTHCAMVALLFAHGLCAQGTSILVNGTPLRIGMLKSEALSSLSGGSELSKLKGPEDAWCVNPKGTERKPGCGALVQFGQDRLVHVSKTLATAAGGDAAAMIAALFSTLQEVAKTGKTDLTFSTQEVETDNHMRLRIVSFIAGDKRYTITERQPVGLQGAASPSVDLTESFVVRIQ